MASKKEKFEEWKKGKDYIMWTKLKEMVDSLDLTSSSFIGYEDLGGLYWEPLLELIYKYGNILKKTYKLKEIKMDYIRPLNYLGAQSDIEVIFDNDKYFVPKLASGKASQARFSFSHLIDSIRNIDILNETNYTKECKTFKSDFNNFLKNLSSFVYEKDENGITGYRYLTENIKLILYPLRMLRKSAYRLFSVEKLEQKYQDLMTFVDKNDIKLFVEGVKQHMETEAYRQNRNCDVNELDKYYERALNEDSYKYKFNDKIHEEEKKVEKDDKGNPKEENKDNKKTIPKTMTIDEIEKLKNDEDKRKLLLVNIKKVEQEIPNIFVKKALQKDLEIGFDLMYKFLNKKLGKDYPFPIDTHKMFVNLYKIPHGREIVQIEYYLGQLHKFIEQLKVMSYEMKLNGLARTLIPIQKNTEYIEVLKKIYDMHNIIDRILGDKLLYDQYLFIYDMIKFIHESVMKEDLEVYKTEKFMEKSVPKYIFFMSMIKTANVYIKFQKNSRKDGGHFTIDQYYQPLKHEIDGPNNIAFNAYEKNVEIKKGISDNYKDTEKILWDEINKFGRFWLMEGYFPPEDRDKWLTAIESLSNINRLVQEDIRDMILTGNDEKFKANLAKDKNENIFASRNSRVNNLVGDKNISSNKILNTDNSVSDTSLNFTTNERKTNKKGTRAQGRKRSTSRKGTNLSKHSQHRDKEKKSTRKDSLDSSDRIIASLPTNKNGLRPPFVWNFPIERIEEIREKTKKEKEKIEQVNRDRNKRMATKKQPKPKLDIVFKEETKKNEIRKVNAYNYYTDGRIERFMNLFDEIFDNCMKYAKSKGNTWEYVYCKILQVFGIEYIFTQPKEELEENKEEKKEDEKKEEEKKEGEKKEEEKKEGENNEEKKEGENQEGENPVENNEEKKEEEKNNEEEKNAEEEKNNEDNNEVILINNDNENKNEEGKNNEELVTESAVN